MNYERLTDRTHDLDLQQRATARCALAICSDSYFTDDAVRAFRQRGHGRHVKTAVDPVNAADTGIAEAPLNAAFLAMVDGVSILGALVARGAVTFPFNGAARLQVGSVVAAETAEATEKAIGRLDFELAGPPKKAQATIVLTAEALQSLDPQTQNAVRDILVAAVARATDTALVNILTAGSPAGNTDIGALFAACSAGSPARPVLLGGLDALLSLSAGTLRDLAVLGITVLPTAAASGLLVAVDCAGLLVSDAGVVVETARHASLIMDSGSGSPASTHTVSLFQQNLAALRAERFLRVSVRDGAVAYASVVGSPA